MWLAYSGTVEEAKSMSEKVIGFSGGWMRKSDGIGGETET